MVAQSTVLRFKIQQEIEYWEDSRERSEDNSSKDFYSKIGGSSADSE